MLNYFRTSVATRVIISLIVGLQLNMLTIGAWGQQRDAITLSAPQGQSLAAEAMGYFSFDDAHMTLQDFFPDDRAGDTTSLESVYGRDTETIDLGSSAQSSLNLEASEEGEAYRTILQSSRRVSPDLSSDPMFNLADTVRDPAYLREHPMFADCSKEDHFEEQENNAHIAAYRTCERQVNETGAADLKHEYTAGVVEYLSGQQNFQTCGDDCIYIWVGTVGDNYWEGHCTVFEEHTQFRVINPDAITSVTIEKAVFDDYFQIYFNDKKLWTHTPGVFPPETSGPCERNTSWDVSPDTDITSDFLLAGETVTFKTRTSVSGAGEGYARIKILFDRTKAITDNGWTPEEHAGMLDMINDGFCPEVEIECTGKIETDESGCGFINGVKICESDMPSPVNGLDSLCTEARVSAECTFYKGQMDCWTDPQGVTHCPYNEGEIENSCTEYEEDPQCGFVSQACVSGAEGDSGACYAMQEVWDCGYDVGYPTAVHTGTTYECSGGMRCMGTECFDDTNKKSGDFAYAVAMLQVAQFAEHDLDCGDGDINQDNTCTVFPGEAMECKKALGGYIDCCEAPDGVSLFDYVNLTMEGLKMSSAVHAFSKTGSLFSPGYWEGATAAASKIGEQVLTGQWGSMVDGATAAFEQGMTGAVDGLISQFQGFMMEKAYDAMVSMGAEGAANAVFENAAGDAGMQLTSNAAAVVNVIGFIYTVYVIADMLVNIIWECEEEEFELGAKKETRQCVLVGSYCASKSLGACVEVRESHCCYSSVVARIIQEQGKPQLGRNFGTPEEPSCEAMSVDDLARIDWNQIDLSEWIGMLSMTDNLRTIDTVSLDHLTGVGSGLGDIFSEEGVDRYNTFDRNVERLDGVDVDAVKRAAEVEAASNIPRMDK